jgi:hypothetical protein
MTYSIALLIESLSESSFAPAVSEKPASHWLNSSSGFTVMETVDSAEVPVPSVTVNLNESGPW